MCFFFSFVPASVFTSLSFFVWFAAGRAAGSRRRWGNYLAIWLVLLALGFIACGAFVSLTGRCPIEAMMGG